MQFCCWADFSKAQPWLCHFLVQNPQSLSSAAILCGTSGQPAVRTFPVRYQPDCPPALAPLPWLKAGYQEPICQVSCFHPGLTLSFWSQTPSPFHLCAPVLNIPISNAAALFLLLHWCAAQIKWLYCMVSSFWPSRSTSALSQSLVPQPCLISRHELRRILTEFLNSIVYSDLKFQHLAIRLWFLIHDFIAFHSWPASQKQSWEITAPSTWPHLWESSGRPRWLGGKEPTCQCKETQETWVQSLGGEDPLEEEITTHPSTLAWRIPWTEEPGGLQSTGSHRVGHD